MEVACPILDDNIRRQINHYLKVMLSDNVKARVLLSDGSYVKKKAAEPLVDSQAAFMEEAIHAKREEPKKERMISEWIMGILENIRK